MKKNYTSYLLAFSLCFLFFIAYSMLSVVRHLHYGSGFDLGIADQIIWKYSHFQSPITTIQFYPFTSLLTDHIELIYVLCSPFYWIYNNVLTLLILQAFFIAFSGIPIYLLTKKYNIHTVLGFVLLFSYLSFYGIQNAIWADVHSVVFGASFLAWFIYFMKKGNNVWVYITFFLTIICKEDLALLTLLISFVYFITNRNRLYFSLIVLSLAYLFIIFSIYFPHFTSSGYRYTDKDSMSSALNISYYYDTSDKRSVIAYSLAWFGFLPLLSPLYLLPAFGNITQYFLLGHHIPGAQTLFEHYRVTLASLLILPTIITIHRFKKLNSTIIAIYIFMCVLFFQYSLHLPLSYVTKGWFWKETPSVRNINEVLISVPRNASIVSQNNITSHIAHRDTIFTLWPDTKTFAKNSPCGKESCNWFHWAGNPTYLIVSTSTDWDIRHLLANRPEYMNGLHNLQNAGVITIYKQVNDAILYKVLKNPSLVQ